MSAKAGFDYLLFLEKAAKSYFIVLKFVLQVISLYCSESKWLTVASISRWCSNEPLKDTGGDI